MKPNKSEGPIRLVLADVDGTLVTQEKVLIKTHGKRSLNWDKRGSCLPLPVVGRRAARRH